MSGVYTPETLADRWQCSPSHVRKMIQRGELPAFVTHCPQIRDVPKLRRPRRQRPPTTI